MRFTASKQALCRALAIAEKAVERRTTIPILVNVKIEASGDGLKITGTDLEVAISVRADANVKEEGVITLPGARLLKYCELLPDGDIQISTGDNNWATITAGRARTRIPGIDASGYPELPSPAADPVTVPVGTFLALINRVRMAISTEESRFTLNGALFEHRDNVLRMVGTDGHRLALARAEVPGGGQKFLLPNTAMKVVAGALSGAANVAVSTDDNHVFLATENVTVTARKLTGSFPNYERVIPKSFEQTTTLNRAALAAAISRVAQFADDRSRAIRLSFRDGELGILAASVEAGEAEDTLQCPYDGKAIEVGFNADYISEFLGAVSSETVNVDLINEKSAAQFCITGTDEYKYVLMPMRI